MLNLVCRIRKQYLNDIMAGKKTIEFRKDSEFWRIRINHIVSDTIFSYPKAKIKLSETNFVFPQGAEPIGVFISGKTVYRAKIHQIVRMSTPAFSEQGQKDVDTPYCWAFHLGISV